MGGRKDTLPAKVPATLLQGVVGRPESGADGQVMRVPRSGVNEWPQILSDSEHSHCLIYHKLP